jgi:hypothetical protein
MVQAYLSEEHPGDGVEGTLGEDKRKKKKFNSFENEIYRAMTRFIVFI